MSEADKDWELIFDRIACGYYHESHLIAAHCKELRELFYQAMRGPRGDQAYLCGDWTKYRNVLSKRPSDYEVSGD